MTAIEEIKAALEELREAVEYPYNIGLIESALSRIAELKKAEPVAWLPECGSPTVDKAVADGWRKHGGKVIPLYTHPAAAPQVPAMRMLTQPEVQSIVYAEEGARASASDFRVIEHTQRKFCEVNGIAAQKEPTP